MKIVHILLGSADPETMNRVNKVVHYLATEQLRTGNDMEVWGLTKNWQRPPAHAHAYPLHFISTTRSRGASSALLPPKLRTPRAGGSVRLHSMLMLAFLSVSQYIDRSGSRFGGRYYGFTNILIPTPNFKPRSASRWRYAVE